MAHGRWQRLRNRSRRPLLLTVAGASLASCAGGDDSNDGTGVGDVTVFAAASLTGAFSALGEAFEEQHPGAGVTFSFAASSELAGQIVEGAPADVFASADLVTMERLTAAGATRGDAAVFAANVAQIVVAPGNPARIDSLADLAGEDLVVITCAPQVPCGRYAGEVLASAGVSVVPDSFEENVRSVVSKVALGEADAGIAYASDVLAADGAVAGVEIPAEVNVVARYPIVVTAEGSNPIGGRAFVDFVLSPHGREILADHGFRAP